MNPGAVHCSSRRRSLLPSKRRISRTGFGWTEEKNVCHGASGKSVSAYSLWETGVSLSNVWLVEVNVEWYERTNLVVRMLLLVMILMS